MLVGVDPSDVYKGHDVDSIDVWPMVTGALIDLKSPADAKLSAAGCCALPAVRLGGIPTPCSLSLCLSVTHHHDGRVRCALRVSTGVLS